MKFIFVIVLIVICGFWGYDQIKSWYYNREQPPIWEGTERLQVCKHPYYSSDDCYFLTVTLIDDKTAKIHFTNGGYVVVRDLICYYAAEMYKDRYKFCRSWDSDGKQWDFMPASVIY